MEEVLEIASKILKKQNCALTVNNGRGLVFYEDLHNYVRECIHTLNKRESKGLTNKDVSKLTMQAFKDILNNYTKGRQPVRTKRRR